MIDLIKLVTSKVWFKLNLTVNLYSIIVELKFVLLLGPKAVRSS